MPEWKSCFPRQLTSTWASVWSLCLPGTVWPHQSKVWISKAREVNRSRYSMTQVLSLSHVGKVNLDGDLCLPWDQHHADHYIKSICSFPFPRTDTSSFCLTSALITFTPTLYTAWYFSIQTWISTVDEIGQTLYLLTNFTRYLYVYRGDWTSFSGFIFSVGEVIADPVGNMRRDLWAWNSRL